MYIYKMGLMSVSINNIEYFIHYKYKSYSCDINGNVLNIITKKTPKQSIDINNQIVVNMAGIFRIRDKILKKHIIYECFNGPLDSDCIILTLNGDDLDLHICNLVCIR